MTWVLIRKLLRDSRWALLVICLILYLFSILWVVVAQRVTTEIAPLIEVISRAGQLDSKLIEKVVFKGPGKVSQAVLGGADIRFERPSDFLAVEMLHPVVIILTGLWAVGRAAGAIAGEIDRGTMELLLSQPIPRDRIILAHWIIDLIVLPLIAFSIVIGTQTGLALAGPFQINKEELFREIPVHVKLFAKIDQIPDTLSVTTDGHWAAAVNLIGLMYAISGITILISACGRNRWRTIGWAVLMFLLMFVINVVGQLWEPSGFLRPFSLFYYYQPQKVWLSHDWFVELGEVWNRGQPMLKVPTVGLLFVIGTVGYLSAWRVFTRRDLPAPL